jgi:putative protein-disulfide isomerase
LKFIYVFDAYCGWSYGFGLTMTEIARRHPDVPVTVVSGGLFTGARRAPVGEFGQLRDANAKISELTGAAFGPGYQALIADGSFVMDSEAAARGFAVLRAADPGSAVQLAEAQQNAFFRDGLSLSEPETYRRIAATAGLDGDAVMAAFLAPGSRAAAAADFARARRIGVQSYPTLLVQHGEQTWVVAVGHATADAIDAGMAAYVKV